MPFIKLNPSSWSNKSGHGGELPGGPVHSTAAEAATRRGARGPAQPRAAAPQRSAPAAWSVSSGCPGGFFWVPLQQGEWLPLRAGLKGGEAGASCGCLPAGAACPR